MIIDSTCKYCTLHSTNTILCCLQQHPRNVRANLWSMLTRSLSRGRYKFCNRDRDCLTRNCERRCRSDILKLYEGTTVNDPEKAGVNQPRTAIIKICYLILPQDNAGISKERERRRVQYRGQTQFKGMTSPNTPTITRVIKRVDIMN